MYKVKQNLFHISCSWPWPILTLLMRSGERLRTFRSSSCLLLHPLWESVIVLCFVVRYFMSILVLQSSWWGRESWLLCLICLPGVSWWLSGSSCGATGLSAVCDCGISWSYPLTIFAWIQDLRLNFLRSSASKCWIRQIKLVSVIYFQNILDNLPFLLEIIQFCRHTTR